jgi:Metallo-peptidase family M12
MLERKLCTGSAVLACLAVARIAVGAPTYQILYHEPLDITARADSRGQQHLGFDAYGRHFDVTLQSNDNIGRAVPASRSDIKPYRGTVAGATGSWVRLTRTQEGWRGIVSDGHELYAVEPVVATSNGPAIYRLADAIIPDGAAYCGTETDANLIGSATGRATASQAYSSIAKDLSRKDTTTAASQQLIVAVVADHTFTDNLGSDPESEIVARMNVVDGIWSSQVGISIVLGAVTVLTDATDTFTSTTTPTDLLSEVANYRAKLANSAALTHLMTGRALDGNIVGISYLGAVCDGNYSSSLSANITSTTEGALITAHELGHSFNAVHDGVAGVCASTPQTYLMAPIINFSNQFSSCSLTSIAAKAQTASCVQAVSTGSSSGTSSGSSSSGDPSVSSDPSGTSGTSTGSSGGGGGNLDFALLGVLAAVILGRGVAFLPFRPSSTADT